MNTDAPRFPWRAFLYTAALWILIRAGASLWIVLAVFILYAVAWHDDMRSYWRALQRKRAQRRVLLILEHPIGSFTVARGKNGQRTVTFDVGGTDPSATADTREEAMTQAAGQLRHHDGSIWPGVTTVTLSIRASCPCPDLPSRVRERRWRT